MNARILGPQMLKRGFSKGYAAGVLSYGSLMAPIIPPGIGFILYGTVGQVSIGRLFAAGIVPGPHAVGGAGHHHLHHGAPARLRAGARNARRPSKEIALASWGGIWALLFPIILLAGTAVRHLHAVGDRRLRRGLRRRDRRLRLSHADLRQLPRGAGRQPGRRRRGDVPARAVGDLRLRHRVRAHPGGDLRLDARRHRQPQRRDGADRAVHPARRHASWKARC